MTRSRRRIRPLGAALLAALLALPGALAPVAAWSNAGNNYGTHDWILDQALRLLDDRGISHSWVDRTVALLATDDPDTVEVEADSSRSIEHVYTGDGGKRGGAVHRITEHYAKIIRLYSAGKTAKVAGDTTTAAAKFREASYNLGMLAHFYGDVLQPYHTSRDAIGMDSQHHAYELLVNSLTKTPTSSSSWSVANTGWTVKDMTNVRTAAISAAAYSRARYDPRRQLLDERRQPEQRRQGRDQEVLIRASGDLANLVSSVAKGLEIHRRSGA